MKTSCRQCILFFFLFFLAFASYSQDVIILKTGDEIKVKVLEVLPEAVKYKKWDNIKGPSYTSNKSEIFMIKYQNGTKDVFNSSQEENKPKSSTNDNTKTIIPIARTFMENQITTESNGALRLIDFRKQNGVQNEMFGKRTYTLEYILTIEAQRNFWKKSEDKFLNAKWFWGRFSVLDQGSKGGWDDYAGNWESYGQGTRIEITGDLTFENTDNGWRITGINIFSKGYKNKSSKIVSNINNTPSPNSTLPTNNTPFDTGYVGDYVDGKKNGKGKMVYAGGSIYDGEWKNDKRNGVGKMNFKDGSTYDGDWRDDTKDGYGTQVWANGNRYIGDFVNGQPQGNGSFTTTVDGTIVNYAGDFVNGKMTGQGEYVWIVSDQTRYCLKGEFNNGNLINGTRTKTLLNGKKYVIEYVNGIQGKEIKQD